MVVKRNTIRASWYVLLAIFLTISCSYVIITLYEWLEYSSSYIESYDSLDKDAKGRRQRGWLPAWLPKTATRIHESHNLDTNEIWLMFSYSPRDKFFKKDCIPYSKNQVKMPRNNNLWYYPRYVSKIYDELLNNDKLHYYYCDADVMYEYYTADARYVAIDHDLNIAYAWSIQ